MKRACTNLAHPKAETGPVVRTGPKAVFVALTCPTCGREQGVKRIRR